jgi:tetratricopeptide (TPR) repeat protein
LNTPASSQKYLENLLRILNESLSVTPNQPYVLYKLANTLHDLKRYAEAVASYRSAIALKPDFVEANFNCGNTLQILKKFDEAVSCYDRAIAVNPNYAKAYANRGNALQELKRLDEAIASYDSAIAINPDLAAAYSNRGIALKKLKRPQESLASYNQAIAIDPNQANAYSNRGLTLLDLKRLDEALNNYEQAITLNPHFAEAYWNKSLLKLLNGEYEEGWALYEWGWKSANRKPARKFSQPLWLGEQLLSNKTLLIYPEQGLGDYIQFIRYAALVEGLGGKAIIEAPAPLQSVISTLPCQFILMENGQMAADFDYQCPVMSLPLAFKTTVETIPAQTPYLYANKTKQSIWQKHLGEKSKPRVGLAWSGSNSHSNDHNRSIPLKQFEPLFHLPIEFHCLQNEIRPVDAWYMADLGNLENHQDLLNDFSDTAALMMELDLVISVDTSIVHLAGALGQKVWILLPYIADFRWMQDSTKTPWYPTARLYRQQAMGEWGRVIAEIGDDLKMLLN